MYVNIHVRTEIFPPLILLGRLLEVDLKMLRYWRKCAVRNLAFCRGAIWCCREKLQYVCTTTVSPVHNSPNDIFENLLLVWLLVRTKLLFTGGPFYWSLKWCVHHVGLYVRLFKPISTVRLITASVRIGPHRTASDDIGPHRTASDLWEHKKCV